MASSDEGITLRLAIGHATIEAAIAEHMLEGLLVGLLESHDETDLGKKNTMGTLVDKCKKELKKRNDLSEVKDEALDLLDQLNELTQRRNRVIHDVVATQQPHEEGEGTQQFVLLQGLWKSPGPGQPISVAEIFQLANEFRAASGALIIWAFTNLPYLSQQWNSGQV